MNITFENDPKAYKSGIYLKVQLVAKSWIMNTHQTSKPVLEECNWC